MKAKQTTKRKTEKNKKSNTAINKKLFQEKYVFWIYVGINQTKTSISKSNKQGQMPKTGIQIFILPESLERVELYLNDVHSMI